MREQIHLLVEKLDQKNERQQLEQKELNYIILIILIIKKRKFKRNLKNDV